MAFPTGAPRVFPWPPASSELDGYICARCFRSAVATADDAIVETRRLVSDTDPRTAALYRALLMERSGEERFLMGVRMFDLARQLVLASLPPELPPEEIRRRMFARLYPDFPPDRLPPDLRR